MLKFCPKCDAERDCSLVTRKESYPVRGEEIGIEAHVYICPVCGEDIFDKDLDSENIRKVYEAYRLKHSLLSSDEIRSIRERYGLSQRGFARLLGWGEITVHRYESGALQDRVHDDLLRMISTPEGMARYLEEHGSHLPAEEAETVRRALANALRRPSVLSVFETSQSAFGTGNLTGYRALDMERLRNMVRFFSEGGVWMTKLNKLLWYADFLAFRRNTSSISGLAYQRETRGPVPFYFYTMLDALEDEGDIRKEETPVFDYVGTMIYAVKKPEFSVFTASEWDVLRYIRDYFSGYNSKAISERSHQERAWLEVPQGAPIPYDYATELSLA